MVTDWRTALLVVVLAPTAFAQLAPSGDHYAGRPSDTGFGGTIVNATGSFAASIPFDLPTSRGGVPVPLQVNYVGGAAGAAGLGWDLALSYIQQGRTFAHRRPASAPDALPAPRERMYMSLLGQGGELIHDGSLWVARYGTLALTVRQSGDDWLAYDGQGRTYRFVRAAGLGANGFWLLKSISAPSGAIVELTYRITTWPVSGGVGVQIDLLRLDYNTSTNGACRKNEIVLSYGYGLGHPLAVSILGDRVLVRETVLTAVDVKSRAACSSALERLRRYVFQYGPDTDTLLPRLSSVNVLGRQGTPEETVSLPVANYAYGRATSNGELQYQRTQTIHIPAGIRMNQISGTALDGSVSAPEPGDRYAMWQSLTDIIGDGRPDLIFKKNNKLWVAYNMASTNGSTSFSDMPQVSLSDATFASGPVSTQTSTQQRFEYAAANRNTTDVWREAIDVNGDGRIDIVDAAEEPDHWVIYLNSPGGSAGVKWLRRSFLVTDLRAALSSSGHKLTGPYVPLSRRSTGTDLKMWDCWRWDGSKWQWYSQGFSNHACQGTPDVLARGPERTFVEWELADLNGDGYPDFVFNSTPVDFQLDPPPSYPGTHTGAIRSGDAFWHQFAPSINNQVRAAYNVVGVRFDTNHSAFSRSVALTGAQGAEGGVADWECAGYSLGFSCDESSQSESVGFADVNGDGLADRIAGTRAYLGVFNGTAVAFSSAYITLPGPLATEYNNHDQQCKTGGSFKPTATQVQGLRDLTGDGIPDYYDKGRVWIGTGTGFRQPIPISVAGATFQFSHETETCDGKVSNTDGGLFDIDGDGKPEIIGLSGSTYLISQLLATGGAGAPGSGRLIRIDNGYGAQTSISYASAKNFTDNHVPFPETVVESVRTIGTLNLGGSLAETRYAYGAGNLVFDSAADRFTFPGYGRTVSLVLLHDSPLGTGKFQGVATVTDNWPLAPFTPGMSPGERWLRTQRVGHVRDVYHLTRVGNPEPWLLLGVDANDTRLIGMDHFDWTSKMYEAALAPGENLMNCFEMVDPLDYASSFGYSLGPNGMDSCRTHGFALLSEESSWYGASPPPSDNNVQTMTHYLRTDDFGRPLVIEYDNDVHRSYDDICVENRFATPVAQSPRVLDAVASRRLYTCGKNRLVTVASERWNYDGLADGLVSSGRLTSHTVDRRATDTGLLLKTIRVWDATYDAAGNLATMTTKRGADTRTTTFSYDPFGLVPIQTRLDATGAPSTVLSIAYDPISLLPVQSGIAGAMQRGIDYGGFGRPIRSTVKLPGGSVKVIATTSYAGFSTADPDGRRITETHFTNPVDPANAATAKGQSQTVFLDELGRERRTEVTLGSDYANSSLVIGARAYDEAGRVHFAADPYVKGQNPATVYGTTYFFNSAGALHCLIRGAGPQPLITISDMQTERFPTCFEYSFATNVQTVDMLDAASPSAGSSQTGVRKRSVATAIGRVIERSTMQSGIALDAAKFTYDHLGQLTSFTRFGDPVHSARSARWAWRMDSVGHLLELHEPDAPDRFYTYSDWGEALETRWFDGADRRLIRSYDSLRRLTSSEEQNNGILDPETVRKYFYDQAVNVAPYFTPAFVSGHLARAVAPSGETIFGYDAYGRVNAKAFRDDQGRVYIAKSEHSADGNLTSLTFNLPDTDYADEKAAYAYDSAGRLRSIKYTAGPGGLDLYKAEQIDPFGRVREALIGGKVLFEAAYSSQGRQLPKATVIKTPLGFRRLMFGDFDPLGRELTRTEFQDGQAIGRKTQVAYDALGRIQRVLTTQGPDALSDWHFRYDPLGNLLLLSDIGSTTTLSYGSMDPDRVCRVTYPGQGSGGGSCNVTYDQLGDIVAEPAAAGLRRFSYFNSGKVRRMDNPDELAEYRYDPFGDVSELNLISLNGGGARRIRRFGDFFERKDSTANGTVSKLLEREIPMPGGGLFASHRGRNGDWVFQFGELRGSRFFANQDGNFVQDVDYQPFGGPHSTGASDGSADYTSQQWNYGDALQGFQLSWLGARIYDPAIGRFLSRDPLMRTGTGAGSNPYAFAVNDPINAADPSGLDCVGGLDQQECSYYSMQTLNPFSLIPTALNVIGGLLSGSTSLPPPPVGSGVHTWAGFALREATREKLGYSVANFNYDGLAARGFGMSDVLDRLEQVPSAEHDAQIAAYNAKLDRDANYSRVAGWTLAAIGTGGIAVSEAAGLVLASRGIVGGAELLGVGTGGGGAAFAGNELEGELDSLDAAVGPEAASATQQANLPRGYGFTRPNATGARFYYYKNAAGGTSFTSTGIITQADFRQIVIDALNRGETVNILTGAHGDFLGRLSREPYFWSEDLGEFIQRGANIIDVSGAITNPGMYSQILSILNGLGTNIAAWCYSDICVNLMAAQTP